MFGMTRGGAAGSEFMDAWVAAGQPSTYHRLEKVLQQHWPNVRVTMQNMNGKDGAFGHPATEVSVHATFSNDDTSSICFGCGRQYCECC
jgi:hypothetical protein